MRVARTAEKGSLCRQRRDERHVKEESPTGIVWPSHIGLAMSRRLRCLVLSAFRSKVQSFMTYLVEFTIWANIVKLFIRKLS